MYWIAQCIGESICRFCQVDFVCHYIEVQCIFKGHYRFALVYVYELTLANYGRGHIAIAVLQVFNDIGLYIAILLGRQDLITNNSLRTNTFFPTSCSLFSRRSLWSASRIWRWRHTNTAHRRRSHPHSIHRRRCATRSSQRWRRHAYIRRRRCHTYISRRWHHSYPTWRWYCTNSSILITTHGSTLYSSLMIYRNKAIGITTWRSKGISTVSRCRCCSWTSLL